MTARDFCYWLQGFFEVTSATEKTVGVNIGQVEMIRRHLALVFAHDIDPSAGSPAVQQKLSTIHSDTTVVRC